MQNSIKRTLSDANYAMSGLMRFCIQKSFVHTVVLLRHGESLWNAEPRFTGWCDIPLTQTGEADAIDAGKLMGERRLKFDVAFTSSLERAWKTCSLALAAAGQQNIEQIRSYKLNERHYGALQGHLKHSDSLLEAFGEEKVMEWRRSYHTPPPSRDDMENMTAHQIDALNNFDTLQAEVYSDHAFKFHVKETVETVTGPQTRMKEFPGTESLKQCEERAFGYWNEVIAPRVRKGHRVLIVAHANTIRALVKAVDNISDDMIAHLKIPNGVPLVYTMDENLRPRDLVDDIGFQAKYLVSPRNHSKTMEYERSTQKKLRSLFEYLDTNHVGHITPTCLEKGLHRLNCVRDKSDPLCEYELEEILRCIPSPDAAGRITLEAFLEAEATLLPELSRLRLLQ